MWRPLVLVAALVAVAAEDAGKKDVKALQGAWKVQSLTKNGEEAPASEVESLRVVFEGDTVTVTTGDKTHKATFKVDAAKKPATIDFKVENEGEHVGIYALDADTLKICFAKGDQRPTEFASKAGSETTYLVLKRDKK
jgi:uncharacterized protein (TIGR03067 family)